MLLLYVDDMLVVGSSMREIVNLNSILVKEFSMDLGATKKKSQNKDQQVERKEAIESTTSRVREKGVEKV